MKLRCLILLSALVWSTAATGQESLQPWLDIALKGTRELLSQKRFADARTSADGLIQVLLLDDRVSTDDERAALTQAVVLRAIAESRTVRNDLAVWDWYVAANLSPAETAKLQKDLEGAAVFPKVEHLWDERPDVRLIRPSDQGPKFVTRPGPSYPLRARRLYAESKVVVESLIETNGRVTRPRVLTPDVDPSLIFAALDAMSKWTFEPARIDGTPAAIIYNLTVNFELGPPG